MVDGPYSIRIDDEARICLFGDHDPSRSGGINVLNFSLEARCVPMAELRELHRDLTAEIEKTWPITKPSDGSDVQWADELYQLMNATGHNYIGHITI